MSNKAGKPTGNRSSDREPLAVLDQAMKHHTAGRLLRAESLYKQILQANPNQPEALHLLGLIAHQVGNHTVAEELISKALAIKPNYVEAHSNLGLALQDLGKLEEAVASYRQALKIKPDFVMAHNNLGLALHELGKLEEAIASYRQALKLKPDFFLVYYNLGNALKRLGEFEQAVRSYEQALGIEPNYVEAHNNLGLALKDLGKLDEAVASYRRALKIKPDFAEAHNNLGLALVKLGKPDEAIASYRRALEIKPDFVYAHSNLAEVLEKTNRTEALRDAVSKAKQSCPRNPRLALAEARLLKREDNYAAARALLEEASEPVTNATFMAVRASLLGDLCDRLGDVEAAYNYFTKSNLLLRDIPEAKLASGARYLDRIDLYTNRFTADWIAGWRPVESSDDRPDPVFLVGFPRSGTTLLDTILDAHPAINAVDELPTIDKVRQVLGQLPGGDPDGLAELNRAQITELRRTYFAELDKHLESKDRSVVVVDKQPLNTVEAGLIHRIFPQARFLFVLRHPCDCVLSCFMQSFAPLDSLANFLDLEDAARLYDKVMTLWQQYQAVLPLAVHTVRYERLVEAFEETMTPVFEYLGVGWDDGVRNYIETAQRREEIKTPSYNQVTQPLYTRARGRWENYREHMQPVLPTLLPWAKHFGYDQ